MNTCNVCGQGLGKHNPSCPEEPMPPEIDWHSRALKAESACAELCRAVAFLRSCVRSGESLSEKDDQMVNRAISTDCGKGWASPEEHAKQLLETEARGISANAETLEHLLQASRRESGLKSQLKLAVEALDAAWDDILHWVQLADRHRESLGSRADYMPYCPTQAGINTSNSILGRISKTRAQLKGQP